MPPNQNQIYIYPAIPDPPPTVEGLQECVRALKQVLEMVVQQRGPISMSCPTYRELVTLEVITEDQIPTR